MYHQPQQKRKSVSPVFIIIAVIVGLIVLSGIANAIKSAQHSNASIPAPTATLQPAPTQKPIIIAQPHLGSPVADFTAKYGTPSLQGVGGYAFQSGNITATTQPNDGAAYGTHVLSILINAPAQGWTETEALAACAVFLPTDATYTGVGTLSSANAGTGIERVYFSTSLIKQFPASEFLDSDLNPTKPGTFAIVLNYFSGSTTEFGSCAIQLQLE